MEAMLSGSPLVFLDVRERPVLNATDRESLIAQVQTIYILTTFCLRTIPSVPCFLSPYTSD